MRDFSLDLRASTAWQAFLDNQSNCGHVQRNVIGGTLDNHVHACLTSARATIRQLRSDLPRLAPRRILEVGCSAGVNCFALQEAFPESETIGLEPERSAIRAAESLCHMWHRKRPRFECGDGENIPLPNRSVDLILCHTVIEHVRSVEKVIQEMARVLSDNGVIYLEAPNYLWPREPHLGVWTIPILGKSFVTLCAHLQGKGDGVSFLEHLQFVTPFALEKYFVRNSLQWHNRVSDKVKGVLDGTQSAKEYVWLTRLLVFLSRAGLRDVFERLIVRSGMYPSVLYSICRDTATSRVACSPLVRCGHTDAATS